MSLNRSYVQQELSSIIVGTVLNVSFVIAAEWRSRWAVSSMHQINEKTSQSECV